MEMESHIMGTPDFLRGRKNTTSLYVTLGVTVNNHRLNIGQFRLTPGHLIGQPRVGKGYLMVTVGQQG